ncbi:carboxypeptidase-like regulatory domain-containing protein [Singulisphaera sp. Ch08]|uniref:Carboxypeptidase-like regulatory domain-containing protein n=1 Tax=Singulisphaera sp. Ch08 TaxID=3120278 RepID=A0AAU7CM80_9BACT
MRRATNHRAARRFRAAVWTMGLLLLGAIGCGDKGQKSTLPLTITSGKVTLNGKPLPEAELEFIPVGDTKGQGGAAVTNEDGRYMATTPFGEEGLIAGDYKVIVSKRVLPEGVHFDTPPDKTLPPADNPYQEILPPKYSDRMSTTLTMKVSSSGDSMNNFLLETKKK